VRNGGARRGREKGAGFLGLMRFMRLGSLANKINNCHLCTTQVFSLTVFVHFDGKTVIPQDRLPNAMLNGRPKRRAQCTHDIHTSLARILPST
jgi:hypothetical protein